MPRPSPSPLSSSIFCLHYQWCTTASRSHQETRTCWNMQKQPMGYRLWWLVGYEWCQSRLQPVELRCSWLVSLMQAGRQAGPCRPWPTYSITYTYICTADTIIITNKFFFCFLFAGAIARGGGYFAKGWGKPIWLDNVRCGSGEYKLINCPKNCIGCHNCNHHEDAGAECPGI